MNAEIPLIIISSLLIVSMGFNFFSMFNVWKLKDKLHKLDKFNTRPTAIEERENQAPKKKGIINVGVKSNVIGMTNPNISAYRVDIEIEEIARYSNGTSKYKSIMVLETDPPVMLGIEYKKKLLAHFTDKYILTKDIMFLEKIETDVPQFSDEDPLLIEKID